MNLLFGINLYTHFVSRLRRNVQISQTYRMILIPANDSSSHTVADLGSLFHIRNNFCNSFIHWYLATIYAVKASQLFTSYSCSKE